MWFEAIGKVKQSQPGKFILGCTGASAIILAVGLTAVPVQAGLLGGLGGLGVGVDVDVEVGGGGVGVGVGVGGGGLGVGVNVGVGGPGVGPGNPTGPGTPTGPGGVVVDDDGMRRAARNAVAAGAMVCAKDGNETAYNGFLVRDRNGAAFGWIHEATVSPEGRLVSVRLQTSGNSCYKLSNASFRIKGDEVWTNADAMKFR